MRLIVIQDGAMVADVLAPRETLTVGTAEDSTVRLYNPGVPPCMLIFTPQAGSAWAVESGDPYISVTINGTVIIGRQPIKSGDDVGFMNISIRAYPEIEQGAQAAKSEGVIERGTFEQFAKSKLPPGSLTKKLDDAIGLQPGQATMLGQINLALATCERPEYILDMALKTFLNTFGAQRAWVGIRRVNYGAMDYVEGRTNTGNLTDLTELGENIKPRALDRSQFVYVPQVSSEDRTCGLGGPLVGPDGTLGMIYLESANEGRKFDLRDLDLFILMANLFAVQLDAILKQIAKHRAETMEGQVSVAHEIQARLTPRKLPQFDRLQFGAFREPGRQTGDLYDILKLGNGSAAVMISQTRATGALPSMLMAQCHAALRSTLMHSLDPSAYLKTLNYILYDGRDDHPLTCFMAVINPDTGRMRYSVAGAAGAFIIGHRGEERPLGSTPPSSPLGLSKTAAYPLLEESIEEGETLALFTSGVTTAVNRDGQVFGADRFINLLCDGFGQLASVMLKEMLSDFRSFTEGGSQPEDVTVILAHRPVD